MRTRLVEQTALTTLLVAACVTFFLAAWVVLARADSVVSSSFTPTAENPIVLAQNPTATLTLPEQPEIPVSPATPGTQPGTTAASRPSGTNPLTGLPCSGAGATSASTIGGSTPDLPSMPAPPNSVYGQNLGAC
jgi:hypothetical protein